MVKVQCNYTAIHEDEISVSKGEMVHILSTNQHNTSYLVHREANMVSPAAEGWLPGHVFTPQHKDAGDNGVR